MQNKIATLKQIISNYKKLDDISKMTDRKEFSIVYYSTKALLNEYFDNNSRVNLKDGYYETKKRRLIDVDEERENIENIYSKYLLEKTLTKDLKEKNYANNRNKI